jgi:CO/xanthine dehydrogenase FAD-binding subunit
VALPVALQLADLGREAAAVAADLVRLLPEPASDGRASGGYRRRMAGVLTRRILVRAGGAA